MPWTGTIMLVAPIAGALAGRFGGRPLVLVGMALQAVALVWIGRVSGLHTAYSALLPAFILGGLGMGLSFAPLSESVMGAVLGHRQGQASSVYNTLRELGGVFGVAILGAVFQHLAPSPAQFLDGFHAALYTGAAVLAGGVAISLLLPGRTAHPAEATVPAPATDLTAALVTESAA
jgi:MFS family permease